MPPRRSNTTSTTASSSTDPPDYGHYRRLIPRNPPDPSTGKVIKKKDPHWHTNRYLIPFSVSANSIHSPKFTKPKPIPDSPPPEGETPGFEITSEKRLLERAARKAARAAASEVTPSESASSAGERSKPKPKRATTMPAEGSSSRDSSRRSRVEEQDGGLQTPREILVAIQKYGMEPSSAVLTRLGISRELYRVFADIHVSPESILRRR